MDQYHLEIYSNKYCSVAVSLLYLFFALMFIWPLC